MTARTMTAADGTPLFVRSWSPAGAARASIVLVHGIAEHSGRYEHVGRHLAAAGFAVSAPDLRGFGRSGGARAFVGRFEDYLRDLDPLVEAAASSGVPAGMIGHSMGGLIVLRYAQTRGRPDFVVLSAPSVEAAVSLPKRLAARLLSRVLPRLSLPNDVAPDQLSTDPAVGEAYFADPLVYPRTTTRLGAEMFSAMSAARRGAIPVPALVIHGEEDTLVPTESSAPLGGYPGVDRITFPGFRHESFNEPGGAEALRVVTAWIEDRLDQSEA